MQFTYAGIRKKRRRLTEREGQSSQVEVEHEPWCHVNHQRITTTTWGLYSVRSIVCKFIIRDSRAVKYTWLHSARKVVMELRDMQTVYSHSS